MNMSRKVLALEKNIQICMHTYLCHAHVHACIVCAHIQVGVGAVQKCIGPRGSKLSFRMPSTVISKEKQLQPSQDACALTGDLRAGNEAVGMNVQETPATAWTGWKLDELRFS